MFFKELDHKNKLNPISENLNILMILQLEIMLKSLKKLQIVFMLIEWEIAQKKVERFEICLY